MKRFMICVAMAASCVFVGSRMVKSSDDLPCLYPSTTECDGTLSTCNTWCYYFYWANMAGCTSPLFQPATPNQYQNSISTVLKSEEGFKEKGEELPNIPCFEYFYCFQDCNSPEDLGLDCGEDSSGYDLGPMVKQEKIDPDKPCT
ncbi:hypothetical protein SH449x_002509 [Pirellulaceae bacterium SH449]